MICQFGGRGVIRATPNTPGCVRRELLDVDNAEASSVFRAAMVQSLQFAISFEDSCFVLLGTVLSFSALLVLLFCSVLLCSLLFSSVLLFCSLLFRCPVLLGSVLIEKSTTAVG